MQSGKVVASIETIVNDLKSITWRQVLYEAVTNALQANATEIKINFIQNSLDIEVSKSSKEFKKTTVKFLNPKDNFSVDYQLFKDDLKNYFLAYFKLLKDENRLIKISICENDKLHSIVESDDIPDFKDRDFRIDKLEVNLQKTIKEYPFLVHFLEYIYDRQKKIDLLKKLTDEKALEKEIHNLFMKQRTSDDKEDYRTNNLWLFDDRFMSYNKIFSDKQIKEIFPKLSENLDRPDILSLISNSYNKDEITDIVIIELKKADEKITPSRAEEQLIDYAGYINEAYQDRKVRIWTYAFLKFDKKTENSLQNKDYNRVLTKSEYPIYYKPFNRVNAIINFVDYKALSDDAENRNRTFMKILGGVGVFE